MQDIRRAPRRLLVFTLAVPIVVAIYLTAFLGGIWAALRLCVAAILGVTVIGSVYADTAVRNAPRVSPLKAVGVAMLAIALVGTGMAPPSTAAASPAEAVIDAAKAYVGSPYVLGAEGPNRFDCSGLIFRAFSDAGEAPRISGKRLRARGYMRWFMTRGLASEKDGRRGDLVVYDNGGHIGIYLGEGKVLSALVPRVSIHGLHSINVEFTMFLRVDWSMGDGAGDGDGGDRDGDDATTGKGKDKDRGNDRGDKDSTDGPDDNSTGSETDTPPNTNAGPGLPRGLATGTLNLRRAAGPDEKIIGWVSRGTTFRILGTGNSPSGALWLSVETRSGKTGWIWARWTRTLDE